MGIPDHLTCLLRNLYEDQEATVRIDMENQTGKAVYWHPAYLTYMQSRSREGSSNPPQYSCLENSMGGGAW